MIRTDRIKERMDALGLSMAAASKRAGFGPDYVRDLFRGRVKDPGSWRLRQLAVALQCSVEYIMGIADEVGSTDPVTATAVLARIPVRGDLLPGYHEVGAEGRWDGVDVRFEFPLVGSTPFDDEWLEVAIHPQLDGRIPTGSLVHVVGYTKGEPLDGPVLLDQFRDGGTLVHRSVRVITGNTITPSSLHPNPMNFLDGAQLRSLLDVGRADAFAIAGIVKRAYLIFDGTAPVPVIA